MDWAQAKPCSQSHHSLTASEHQSQAARSSSLLGSSDRPRRGRGVFPSLTFGNKKQLLKSVNERDVYLTVSRSVMYVHKSV